jgi:hypothetical protein
MMGKKWYGAMVCCCINSMGCRDGCRIRDMGMWGYGGMVIEFFNIFFRLPIQFYIPQAFYSNLKLFLGASLYNRLCPSFVLLVGPSHDEILAYMEIALPLETCAWFVIQLVLLK